MKHLIFLLFAIPIFGQTNNVLIFKTYEGYSNINDNQNTSIGMNAMYDNNTVTSSVAIGRDYNGSQYDTLSCTMLYHTVQICRFELCRNQRDCLEINK